MPTNEKVYDIIKLFIQTAQPQTIAVNLRTNHVSG